MILMVRKVSVGHVEESREEGSKEIKRSSPNEAEEITVIPLTDTGAGPGAVVVEDLDAAVAVDAVLPARRAVNVAGLAVLGAVQRVDRLVF